MSNILLPDYIITSDSVDANGRIDIIGRCVSDDFNNLPGVTEFDGFNLVCGSETLYVLTGETYYMDSGGNWYVKAPPEFQNVYTKSEIDTLLTDYYTETEVDTLLADYYTESEVDTLLADYYTKSEVDSLILSARDYCLLLNSPLNLISVTSGTSTGYFVENLAITLPAGTYTWKMQRDGNTTTSMRVRAADDTSLYNVTRGAGVNDITQEFTIADAGAKISIYTGAGVNVWGCLIYKTG